MNERILIVEDEAITALDLKYSLEELGYEVIDTVDTGQDAIDTAAETIIQDEDLQIYTSGATNIFKYPELADQQNASDLISAFEEKTDLTSLVETTLSSEENETGIQVYIGNEMPMEGMQDCSVVTATYDLGKGMKGTVGVIGPKRMDYDRVIDVLKQIMSQLDDLYKK